MVLLGVALNGQDRVVGADRLGVGVGVVGAAQRLRVVIVGRLQAAPVVLETLAWSLHDGAVVAREPAAHAVDHPVPPSALQLRDDLDNVALAEAQAGAVVGVVVVERLHVHAPWRNGTTVAVHGGGGGGRRDASFRAGEGSNVALSL
ncbi:hypothetical protein OPT61_g6925 [Boeremia exigua]|uniref:Uncharacterized protein n=1 Tax=Boeremia exigua TaxID=749465 RepID=A0ACC2I599_9PLEO|nr:hypothetical protein OPT61_g6925 [Boeremia exigua]